jgi:flagellar biosynthesis protein FlhG
MRAIAISSGKGGVGKTFVSLQLAAWLATLGKSVLLFDGDLGLANLHVLLGLNPESDLSSVLAGEKSLKDICIRGPLGIQIIPGASGVREMAELTEAEVSRLFRDLFEQYAHLDYILIDTGAGIGSHVTSMAKIADEMVVVVRDEPASLADAYGLIKVMHTEFVKQHIKIIMNDCADPIRAKEVFLRLDGVSTRFIGLPLQLAGVVPHDESVKAAALKRQLLVEYSKDCAASKAIALIASELINSAESGRTPLAAYT